MVTLECLLSFDKGKKKKSSALLSVSVACQHTSRCSLSCFFFFFVGLSYLTFNNLIQAQGERIKLGGLMKLDKNFNSFL